MRLSYLIEKIVYHIFVFIASFATFYKLNHFISADIKLGHKAKLNIEK